MQNLKSEVLMEAEMNFEMLSFIRYWR